MSKIARNLNNLTKRFMMQDEFEEESSGKLMRQHPLPFDNMTDRDSASAGQRGV